MLAQKAYILFYIRKPPLRAVAKDENKDISVASFSPVVSKRETPSQSDGVREVSAPRSKKSKKAALLAKIPDAMEISSNLSPSNEDDSSNGNSESGNDENSSEEDDNADASSSSSAESSSSEEDSEEIDSLPSGEGNGTSDEKDTSQVSVHRGAKVVRDLTSFRNKGLFSGHSGARVWCPSSRADV